MATRRGRNNEGSIFKPGSRRPAMLRKAGDEAGARAAEAALARTSWYIQYTDRPGHTAQPESARTLVKAEAQALLRKRTDAVRLGQSDPRAFENLLVGEMFDDLKRHLVVDGKLDFLKETERRMRLYLTPFFGAMKAARIGNSDVERYILARRGPPKYATDSTIVNELGALRQAYRQAAANGKFPKALVPDIKFPSGYDHVREGFLKVEQYRELQPCLTEDLRAMVALAFYTGMRLGELAGLRWARLDLAEGTISLSRTETKNGHPRKFKLPTEPLQMLRMQRSILDGLDPEFPFVFFRPGTTPGTVLPVGATQDRWNESCVKAGFRWPVWKCRKCKGTVARSDKKAPACAACQIQMRATTDGLRFHDLRRSAARRLVRAGVREKVAMEITGHRSSGVFRRYDITDEADLDDAAAKLDRADARAAVPEPEQQASAPEVIN